MSQATSVPAYRLWGLAGGIGLAIADTLTSLALGFEFQINGRDATLLAGAFFGTSFAALGIVVTGGTFGPLGGFAAEDDLVEDLPAEAVGVALPLGDGGDLRDGGDARLAEGADLVEGEAGVDDGAFEERFEVRLGGGER